MGRREEVDLDGRDVDGGEREVGEVGGSVVEDLKNEGEIVREMSSV